MPEETKTKDSRKRPPIWAILIAVIVVVIIMLAALRMYRQQQAEPIPTQASVEQSQFLQPPADLHGF